MKIGEKITEGLAALVLGGVLMSDENAEAKVTKVYRRGNDTIIKIYDDADRGGYLYPVYICDKCGKTHSDKNRRIVGLLFETESGRRVDYPPQIDMPR